LVEAAGYSTVTISFLVILSEAKDLMAWQSATRSFAALRMI
jgi:hypothetical protein